MLIEIDEALIKEQVETEVKKIALEVISRTVKHWNFEDKIKVVVNKELDLAIAAIIAEEVSNSEAIRKVIHEQMVKRCKAQLDRAIKATEILE